MIPLPPSLFSDPAPAVELVDRHDQPLRLVRADGSPFSERVAYGEIPLPLVQATLAAEDRRFWSHPGVDWRGTARAALQLVVNRRVVSGGSTISQQLIKLANPRPRTFPNKLIEALQALRLEQVWDKQRILAEYFNRLEYGNYNTGSAAAARFYFAKPPGDLSVAECALLAGLPQAPSRLNPLKHFSRAQKRQQWILQSMRQCGYLTGPEFARARQEPLRLAKPRRVFEAPHFVDLLLSQQAAALGRGVPGGQGEGEERPPHPVRRVRTTLDLELNRFAEGALRENLARVAVKNVHNGALVILDTKSGEVLALVGSQDYFAPADGQVNGAWAPRSAGSTFKPFTYLLALEQGATPATVVADVPTEFATATGLFAPVNYDRHCYGPVRYRLALANSLNIPAVKVLASVGGAEVLQRKLRACGLSTLTESAGHYGLGLTIGNAEARLLELASAYACLARLGEFKRYALLPGAERDEPSAVSARRVADPDAAYLIADMLSDNIARTKAFGAESPLRFDFPVACKTGTSSDFRDNWAFGYTPEFTVGVWVGNFDNRPMRGVSGVSGAGPILHALWEHLHARYGTTWYGGREQITKARVRPLTGKRVQPGERGGRGAEDAVWEKFAGSALPPWERPEDYDAEGRVRLESEYQDWARSTDNHLVGRVVVSDAAPALRVVFPPPGTTIYLDPDLPGGGRRLRLQASAAGDAQWSSDSLECREEAGERVALLTKGRHELRVHDPGTGLEARTWINVLDR